MSHEQIFLSGNEECHHPSLILLPNTNFVCWCSWFCI